MRNYRHGIPAAGVAAAAVVAIAALVGGSAFAFAERGQSDDHAAEVALDRRADPADLPANNLQEPDDAVEAPVDMAAVIGEAFGVDPGEVTALHDQGIGYGAIFKLYAFAGAKGTTVDALLATIPADPATGDRDFAFGQMRKSLSSAESSALREGPKNLGQVVSASRRAQDRPATH